MRSSLRARLVLVVLGGAVAACAAGCSAGAPPWPSTEGPEGGSGPGALPSLGAGAGAGGAAAAEAADAGARPAANGGGAGAPGATAGAAGAAGGPPLSLDAGTSPAGELCQESFQTPAQPPTVLVVADRSGSMFDPLAGGAGSPWVQLRSTLLALVLALQDEVRFGFTAYSGDSELCPELSSLPPALGNHAAIEALYGSLEASGRRNGGPFGALDAAASLLAAPGGARHVWLVSDGNVDYCADGNLLCPVDSAVGQLQRLSAASPPIRTTVFGIAPATSPLPASALQAFANAGAGQPVTLPTPGTQATDPNAIFDQCSGVSGWASDFASTGKPVARGQSVADYSGSAGAAVVHPPAADINALLAELRPQLGAERPCSFELAAASASAFASGESIVVELGGTPINPDEQNGWRLVAGSTLVLDGASCAALRAAAEPPTLQVSWCAF